MFGVARWVVQHKVGTVAMGALFMVMVGGNKETPKPVNPWSAEAHSGADGVRVMRGSDSGDRNSMTSKALNVVGKAAKAVGVDGMIPDDLRKQNADNWASAAETVKVTNGN